MIYGVCVCLANGQRSRAKSCFGQFRLLKYVFIAYFTYAWIMLH